VYPSTAAQYFHALRRQVIAAERIPLVCFTPKRYLRMRHTRSPRSALATGAFELVLDDRATLDRDHVARVVVCTGKIAHELMDERDARHAPVAIVRVEQLYPWPEARLAEMLGGYPNAHEVWWVQEEPENMGAWAFVRDRIGALLPDDAELRPIARAASASPASGSTKVHDREQRDVLTAALA
jgi:2-oxoglutarate dehydrogenase complex dehydrogenase (E1) component-like enzyme